MRHIVLGIGLIALAMPVAAQQAPRRTRVGLGPQLVPSFPGARTVAVRPLVDVARARGDDPFAFEAADESAGFALWQRGRVAVGPAIGFEGKRSRTDVGPGLDEVGFTVEAGGFVQIQLTPAIRLRAEARKGIGGHRALIGNVGADYVIRDGDRWLVAVGPRVTLSDDRYNRSFFGVTAREAVTSGLPAYRARGGVQAAGAAATLVRQFGPRWGVYGYAKYDRLVGDAADSPIVRAYGSRNQWSGGVALTRTFGGR